MRLHFGCQLTYQMPAPTPMILLLSSHYSRASDLESPDLLKTSPSTSIDSYRDGFGNWCSRLIAPPGWFEISTDGVIRDNGLSDPVGADAVQHPVEELSPETILYLLGSRYCETDKLSEAAWDLFNSAPLGWSRVQTVCDWVHDNVEFGYEHSDATRTAAETFAERRGVCRDFTHLAITFCRALNIPARYCTGYISDEGQPPPYAPMDFCAWMEVWLGNRWWIFDPRNNDVRFGRILIARGRDAADVPLSHGFGQHELTGFHVHIAEAAD